MLAKFSIFFWEEDDIPKVFNMKKDTLISVGRDLNNDFIINLNSVSRKHGVFFNTKSKLHYIDYSSSFGTFLNGKKILNEQAITLNAGDKLNLGGAELTISSSIESSYIW